LDPLPRAPRDPCPSSCVGVAVLIAGRQYISSRPLQPLHPSVLPHRTRRADIVDSSPRRGEAAGEESNNRVGFLAPCPRYLQILLSKSRGVLYISLVSASCCLSIVHLVPCSCCFEGLGWFVFLQPLTACPPFPNLHFSTSLPVCFGPFSPRSLLLPWRGACFHRCSFGGCLFASVA
jgi:hypothetical protein